MDPNLKAHVEYSNEIWNGGFAQHDWLADKAAQEWGPTANGAFQYYAKRATEVALIWEDAFGAQAAARLVNVLGTQTGNPDVAAQIIGASAWQANEPGSYVPLDSVFEALAVTSYFGGSELSSTNSRNVILNNINDPNTDAQYELYSKLRINNINPSDGGAIHSLIQKFSENKDIADANGMNMILYEGGHHLIHKFNVSGLTESYISAVFPVLHDFVRSQYMADLYEELWDVWADNGPGRRRRHVRGEFADQL